MPTGSAHASMGMAVALAGGGIYGYVKAKSVPSLLGGLGIASLFAYSAERINNPTTGDPEFGHNLALSASILTSAIMGRRYLKTKTMMPAGSIAILGAISTVYQAKKVYEWRS